MTTVSETDVFRLRVVLRDLLALSAVPGTRARKELPDIAGGRADVLTVPLDLDFVFVRPCDANGGTTVEISCGKPRSSLGAIFVQGG
jgi:hypothetical protein